MKGAGAQVLEEPGLGLENQHRDVLLRQGQGGNQSHRPGTHHDDAVRAQYTLQTMFSYLAFGPTRSQLSIQS